MHIEHAPLVSIGMPIFNEEEHLDEALNSILNQTYKNISINIVDNCSKDGTGQICKKYASIDSRINYVKNKKNIGSGLNFLKVVELSMKENAKYFFFARGDAFYSEKFIEKSVLSLEKSNDVILAYAIPKWVNSKSKVLDRNDITYYNSKNSDILIRSALAILNKPFQLYGIIRSKYVKIFFKDYKPYIGDDNVLMFFLSLNGSFDLIKDENWYRRYNYKNENYRDRMNRYKNILLEKKYSIRSMLPNIYLFYKYINIIKCSNFSMLIKIKLLITFFLISPIKFLSSYGKSI